ncbi:MAG: SelT/SelW/SelH family protein [Acidobacteriota bacterium]
MAAELKQAFGVDPVLIKGSGGVFDVVVDGKGVFSKLFTGRFPEPGEVVELIRRRQAAS